MNSWTPFSLQALFSGQVLLTIYATADPQGTIRGPRVNLAGGPLEMKLKILYVNCA